MFCESWILKYTSFICIYILIINGPLAEKRDLVTISENLKIMYILKILSV